MVTSVGRSRMDFRCVGKLDVQGVESSWNVMAHGDARKGKWKGNWRMEWVASALYKTSENRSPSITTADAHTSASSSRLNWRPRRFNWIRPFRRKTKSGFCACAITFQMQSTAFVSANNQRRSRPPACYSLHHQHSSAMLRHNSQRPLSFSFRILRPLITKIKSLSCGI
jgi:hypothetical protein